MDTFALGLRIADKMITDGRLDSFVADRYASWKTGIGADIIPARQPWLTWKSMHWKRAKLPIL